MFCNKLVVLSPSAPILIAFRSKTIFELVAASETAKFISTSGNTNDRSREEAR